MSGTRPDRTASAPVRLRPTTRGAAVLLLLLGAVTLSVALPLAELRSLAVTLGLGLLAALGTILPSDPRPLDLTPEPARTVHGGEAGARILIGHDGRRPRRGAVGELALGAGRASLPVVLPPLSPGDRHAQLLVVPTARRGVLDLGPVRQVREDALGLWRREDRHGPRARLSIAPRTVRLLAPAPAQLHAQLRAGLIDEVDDQELALAVLHSLALRRIVAGHGLRVHLEGRARPVTSLAELQDELARWSPPPAGPHRPTARGSQPTGPCTVVTGPGAGPRELRSWSRRRYPVERVIRCATARTTRSWTLGPLAVLDLGRLEDLPQALAQRGSAGASPARLSAPAPSPRAVA